MTPERDMEPLDPLGGPLAPEVEAPRIEVHRGQEWLYEDDKDSALLDEWRAEEREWLEDFREQCREYR